MWREGSGAIVSGKVFMCAELGPPCSPGQQEAQRGVSPGKLLQSSQTHRASRNRNTRPLAPLEGRSRKLRLAQRLPKSLGTNPQSFLDQPTFHLVWLRGTGLHFLSKPFLLFSISSQCASTPDPLMFCPGAPTPPSALTKESLHPAPFLAFIVSSTEQGLVIFHQATQLHRHY